MHSFGYRANALLTFAVTILAVMCTMASFSDNFNIPSPSADVKVSFLSQFMLLLLSFLGCCFVFWNPRFGVDFDGVSFMVVAGAEYQLVSEAV